MADDADMMAAMGITGFGKVQKKRTLTADRFDKTKREVKPAAPPTPALSDESDQEERLEIPKAAKSSVGSPMRVDPVADVLTGVQPEPEYDPDEFADEDAEETDAFPLTHELELKDHTKVVSALALDPSGARIVSGSHDYDVKLWDFGGMDSRCKPFKSWEPAESYYVHDVKWSYAGDQFIVVSGTTQPKLYGRDGEEISTFIKGDMYIRDMKNTKGHVFEVLSCAWHPKDPQLFITSSADSTIRIWNTENKREQKTVIVVKSKERGARTKVTACSYSHDGKMIAGACLDGAIHVWNTNSNFVRPNRTVEGAHKSGRDIGSIIFSVDGRTLLTRGGDGDDSVKLWDLKAFKKPVAERGGLTTLYPGTNAVFSPDEKFVLTSASATVRGPGSVVILERAELTPVRTLTMPAPAVRVLWHPKINQLLIGLANGQINVLYSPLTSANGAKLLANKGPPRARAAEDLSGALVAPTILTPGVHEEVGNPGLLKRKREDKGKVDPRKLRRPELPITGPGRGGRVGASATQHIVQHLFRDTSRDQDPREALLKYAEQDGDASWTKAWKETQPKPVFAATVDEEEENKDEEEG